MRKVLEDGKLSLNEKLVFLIEAYDVILLPLLH